MFGDPVFVRAEKFKRLNGGGPVRDDEAHAALLCVEAQRKPFRPAAD